MSTIRRSFTILKSRNVLTPIRPYASHASAAGIVKSRRGFFPNEVDDGESAVYNHAMKFQKPSVLKWSTRLHKLENMVSFIGTVLWPIKVFDDSGDATTDLVVKYSLHSENSFRITLRLVGDMAKVCSQHLKPDDFIYVSGQLERFVTRNSVKRYKVIVKELNYVAKRGEVAASSKRYRSVSSDATPLEKYRTRLHLWQLFFANPQEWWDNRNSKKNPRSPDFKHKDTGEVLWLYPDDPPWIKAQLQVQDSRMSQYRHIRSRYSDTRPGLSKWSPDDLV